MDLAMLLLFFLLVIIYGDFRKPIARLLNAVTDYYNAKTEEIRSEGQK